MSLVKVRFLKTAANATYSANPGDVKEVSVEEAKALVADYAAVVVAEKPAKAPAAETPEAETAQAPTAPENASATPAPRRARR